MNWAVLGIGGHQYVVSEGESLLVDKIDGEPQADVLLTSVDGKVSVGTPTVAKAKVALKLEGNEQGDKVRGFKYKSKSRYRRTFGIRPVYSKIVVEKIG